MTVDEDDFMAEIATDSHRYGNEKTIEEVFENPFDPRSPDLQEALADTVHLTEKEAFAFAQGHFGGLESVPDEQLADEMAHSWGFESFSEYKTVKATAMEKVADAIWIYELIDAYRFSLPDECSNCGAAIEGAQFEIKEEEAIALCRTCADESENEYIEEQRLAILDELEALLEDMEAQTGQRPDHDIRQELTIARENLLDDDKFGISVRFGLVKLDEAAVRAEDGASELCGQIEGLMDRLSERAALPQDQLTR